MLELDRVELLVLLDGLDQLLRDRRRQHESDVSPDSHFLLDLRTKMEKNLHSSIE